jgi:uncharacterized protein
MNLTTEIILLLSAVSFVAGFIDSIAGGGGLLTLPSLLLAGVPPQIALGTNKFTATLGTGVAVGYFVYARKVVWKVVLTGVLFTFMGSYSGSRAILAINPDVAGKLLVFLLPLAAALLFLPRTKSNLSESIGKKQLFLYTPLVCLLIGFYDGFFGPGTGTFLTISLFFFLRLNLLAATATAKVFNLASNVSALFAFVMAAKVLYVVAIPMAAANMAGNFIGSRLALKKGQTIIRYFLIIALVLLTISLAIKYF